MLFRHFFTVVCGVLVFNLFVGMASASQITDHRVVVDVDDKYVAHFKVVMTFAELDTDRVSYLVFARVGNPRASDILGELECSAEKQAYGTQISCIPKSKMKINYTVEFEFEAYDLVKDIENAELFSYSYGVKSPTSNFSITIIMPPGAALLSAIDFDPYFPSGATIGTELGRRVFLEWDVMKPELGRTYTFGSYFEYVGVPVNPQPDEGNDFGNPIMATFLVLILVVAVTAAVFYIGQRRGRKSSERDEGDVKRVFSVLMEDERKVIDAILEKGDKCKQRDIVKATDFSKAKVSRIMAELEARGIITRTRVGRTNKVIINESFEKKQPPSTAQQS